jgi:hypothetical protein
MKTAIGLYLVCAAAIAAPAGAQRAMSRTAAVGRNQPGEVRSQAVSFRNPYTSATVSADLMTPGRSRPVASVVLLTGSSRREKNAATTFARFLADRGYAVMSLPPVPPGGATEDESLNTVASLHYLETRPDLRGAPTGLVGYGDGVRLAATAASEGSPAKFLMLLGGAVVPDKLNTVPDGFRRGALPKDEAVRSLQHLSCPVLILIGEYDRQETHRNAAANADALRAALDAGRHKNYTIKVLIDSDDLLAETRAGGGELSDSALPPLSVWRTAVDWSNKQVRALDDYAGSDNPETAPSRPIRLYPKSIYGPFSFRPEMIWAPAIGGQSRPYGFWYW